jgi:hypothetical protein
MLFAGCLFVCRSIKVSGRSSLLRRAIVPRCSRRPICVGSRCWSAIELRQNLLVGGAEVDEGGIFATPIGMREGHPRTERRFHLLASAISWYAQGAVGVHYAIIAF